LAIDQQGDPDLNGWKLQKMCQISPVSQLEADRAE